MNRIAAAIAKIEVKCKTLSPDKLATLGKQLDMQIDEYVKFQELKSLGSLDETLSLDEAMTIYGYLGNTPDHFNAQPAPVKVVLTQCFSELLTKKISKLQHA